MKTPVFLGAATALITPFRNQKVDLSAFEQLIDLQPEAQIPALVVCGTTGEASTLSDDEKVMLFEHAVRYATGEQKSSQASVRTTQKNPSALQNGRRTAEQKPCWQLRRIITNVHRRD